MAQTKTLVDPISKKKQRHIKKLVGGWRPMTPKEESEALLRADNKYKERSADLKLKIAGIKQVYVSSDPEPLKTRINQLVSPLETMFNEAEECANGEEHDYIEAKNKLKGYEDTAKRVLKTANELKKACDLYGQRRLTCKTIIGTAEANYPLLTPEPLNDMVNSADALANNGLYTEATAALKGFEKTRDDQVKLANEETASSLDYNVKVKQAREWKRELDNFVDGLADSSALQPKIEKAEVLGKNGKFKSALAALTDIDKDYKQALSDARNKEKARNRYVEALRKANLKQTEVENAKGMIGPIVDVIRAAAALAEDEQFDEATKKCGECEKLAKTALELRKSEFAKKEAYEKDRLAIDTELQSLETDHPLIERAPLEKMRKAGEVLANLELYKTALDRLSGHTKVFKKLVKNGQELEEQAKAYNVVRLEAEEALKTLVDTYKSSASPWPLQNIIDQAKNLADLGNYVAAKERLNGYQDIARQQTELAQQEKLFQTQCTKELADARQALAVLQDLPLAIPTPLEQMINKAASKESEGKYLSAVNELLKWRDLNTQLTREAEQRSDDREEYKLAHEEILGSINEVTMLGEGADPGMLRKMLADATILADTGNYAEALAALKQRGSVRDILVQEAKANQEAKEGYLEALKSANEGLVELNKLSDLCNPQRLADLIKQAEKIASNKRFADALKIIQDWKKISDEETKVHDDNENALKRYGELLNKALDLQEQLKEVPLATSDALDELINSATALAISKQYHEAVALLLNAETTYNSLVQLAETENSKGNDQKYAGQLEKAQKAYKKYAGQLSDEDSQNLEARLKDAEALGTEKKFASALKLLADFEKNASTQAEQHKKELELKNKNTEFKIKYDKKIAELNDSLQSLTALPGTQEVIGEVNKQIQDSKAFLAPAKPEDYEKAYKAITGTRTAIEKATKNSGKKLDDVGDDKKKKEEFQKWRKTAEKSVADFAEFGAADEVQGFRQDLADAFKLAVDQGKVDEAIEALKAAVNEMTERQNEQSEAKSNCEKLLENISPALENLTSLAPIDQVSDFRSSFEQGKGMVDNRDYAAASELLESLETQVNETANEVQKSFDEWKKKEPTLKALDEEIGKALEEMGEESPEAGVGRRPLLALKGEIATLLEYTPVTRDYLAGVQDAEALRPRFDTIKESLEEFTNFNPTRTDAGKKMEQKKQVVVDALAELVKKMKDVNSKVEQHGDFTNELNRIWATWERGLAAAVTDDDLNVEATETALSDLVKEINALADDSEKLGTAVNTEANREDEKIYLTDRAEVQKTLLTLQNRGGEEVDKSSTEFDRIDADAPKDYVQATSEMRLLGPKLTKLLEEIDSRRMEAVVKGRTRVEAARKEMEKIQKAAASEFQDFFAEMGKELDEIASMAEANNISVIDQSLADLEKLLSRMRVAAAQAKDTTPGADNLKAVLQMITSLGDSLDTPAVKECVPTMQTKLKEELTKKTTETKTLSPADAMKILRELETRVNKLVEDATSLAEKRKAVSKLAAEVLRTLNKSIKNQAPAYYEKLAAQLNDAKTVQEKGEDTALAAVQKMKVELETLLSGPGASVDDLIGKEKKARNDKQKQEHDKSFVRGQLESFKKGDMAKARAAVKSTPGGDPSLLTDIDKLTKEAENLFKSADYEEAKKKLAQAIAVARDAIKEPKGTKATSRNNLKEVNTRWIKSVVKLREQIDTAKDAILKLALDPEFGEDSGVKDIGGALDDLKLQVAEKEFEPMIRILRNDKADLAVRRAAREKALRRLRLAQTRLNKSALLKVLKGKNPAGVAPVVLKGIMATIMDLDLNLQRSV